MSREGRVVNKNRIATHSAVVSYVGISHDEIAIADLGQCSILNGATMNRHIFANDIVVTDM